MKLKTILPILGLLSLTHMADAQSKFNLLIGTYTNKSNSEGIYVYEFDAKTGNLTYKSKAAGVDNPSYLAIAPDRKHVYSVNEIGTERTGSISAFNYDAATGKLSFINKKPSGGNGPCYVSADATGHYVFSGNYAGGTLAALKLQKDGSLSDEIQVIKHEGGSVDKARQEQPHVHSVVLSPDNNYLFTPDLGTDKVNIYRFDAAKASPLSEAKPAFITVTPGSGPRHITFHPNGKYAYLIQEMSGLISAYRYKDGTLTFLQSVSMVAEGFKGKTGAAAVHISPDGKFLYGSNRGDANELVIYALDTRTGKLKFAGRQSTLGIMPRDFAVDPTGNFVLVAHQESQDIIVFKRDKKTGLLSPTGKRVELGRPVCLKFVKIG